MKRVIIGPPGTGKTATLIKIAAERISKYGSALAFLAFTKRASGEAKTRMKLKLDDQPLHCRTVHSLCFHQLAYKKIEVFDIDGFAMMEGLHCNKKKFDPDENEFYMGATEDDLVIFQVSFAKAKGMCKEELSQRIQIMWNKIERYKKQKGLKDFDDMLVNFANAESFRFPKLHTIILDEAQDLTFRQRQAFNALCEHNPDALIIEALDPDQAIFSWAGSEVYIDDSADIEVLGQSYRVPEPVHDYAMKVIRHCRIRKDVNWAPAKHEGTVKWITDIEEINREHFSNSLILVRNDCFARSYINWLREQGIDTGPIGSRHSVCIGTIHKSKGAEADNVLLDLNMTKKTWDQSHTDDERRVWYTAITRAKKNLFLIEPRARCNAYDLLA